MARAQRDMGDVEILVNNAGIQHVAPVHEFEEDKWNDLIAVRSTCAELCTCAAHHTAFCCKLDDKLPSYLENCRYRSLCSNSWYATKMSSATAWAERM